MRSAHQQRGYLLITVVVALFLLATVAVMLTHGSAINANSSGGELAADRAEYVTQAGMQHALWRAGNNACMGDVTIGTTALGVDSYTASISGAAAGTPYSLVADQDAWIRSDDVTRNNGTNADQHIRFESGNTEHALTRFDLSSLPANARINSAVASFYISGAHPEGPITVHQVTTDWTESGATWDSIGGEFGNPVLATIPAQSVDGIWVSFNLTGQVQAWVNGQINYGILFASTAEGVHGRYSSREDGGNAPRLEVVVGSGSASPVTVQATGTLADGNTRSLTHLAHPALQPLDTYTFQPDALDGIDAYIWEAEKTTNKGTDDETWVSRTSNNASLSLFKFNMGAIPGHSKVRSATLSLHNRSGNNSNVPVTAHRITNPWNEDFVTWNDRDSGTSWDTAGGDIDPTVIASTYVGPTRSIRYEWDITGLVQDWIDGAHANYGVALATAMASSVGERFDTSDHIDPTRRPILTIEYACECGMPCQAPQGSGNLLMVIGNSPSNPSTDEESIRDFLESWGYTVSFIQDDDSQGNFNAGLAANDAVFISETVNANNVGTKLTGASIGVVSAERNLIDELGIATGNATPVGNSIDVVNNSHFITSIFPATTLPLKTEATQMAATSGTVAPGAQVLAQIGSDGGLVALEKGAASSSGGSVAGRRVLVPVGEGSVSWNYLTNYGRLVVQRSLSWATTSNSGASGKLLLVVGDANNPAAKDTDRRDLFETWGYTVTLIDDGADQAKFDTEAAANDVIYVSDSIADGTLANKLTNSTVGLVSEEGMMLDKFGLGSDVPPTTTTWNTFTATDAEHYIGEPFAGAGVTLFTQNITMPLVKGTHAPDLQVPGLIGLQPILVTLDAGAKRWDDTPSTGRRAHLPFGAANIGQLTPDGLTLMRRSIEWAAGAGPNAFGPVAHWKLDDGTGTTAIDSEGGHHGTLTNGPVWVAGQLGDALYFDGSNDLVSVPHHATFTQVPMTVSAWFKLDTLPTTRSEHGTIIDKRHTDDPYASWTLYVNEALGNKIRFQIRDSSETGYWLDSAASAVTNTWYHVVGTIDASHNAKLYVNGALEPDDDNIGSLFSSNDEIRIGAGWSGGNRLDGVVDDVRFYDRALSESEVADLYNEASGGPIAHWKFDDGTGVIAIDSVGGHDGTLVNSPSWVTGHLDDALSFDGSNDAVRVPHADTLSITETMTFTAWVNASSFGSTYQTILAKDGGGSGSNYWFGTWRQLFVFGFFSGGLFREVFNPTLELQPNNWYHLAATFDSTTGDTNLYVDGVLVQNGTLAFDPTAVSADLGIGRSPDGERWRGVLDDVRIYDELLSAAKIAELAGGGGGGGNPNACDGTFRDEFNQESYANNDGTLQWATDWLEINENDGWDSGDERVVDNDSDFHLQVRDNDGGGEGVQREADLSNSLKAGLTYEYRRDGFDNNRDFVMVQISANGGSSWTELERIIGPGTDSSYVPRSHNISAYIAPNTRVRFLTSANLGSGDELYIDNIQIEVGGCAK